MSAGRLPATHRPEGGSKVSCPFIDGTDERCSRTLTLRNVQQAVSFCAYDYLNCPVYRTLKARGGHVSPSQTRLVRVTP
jgi:hypothetical protein